MLFSISFWASPNSVLLIICFLLLSITCIGKPAKINYSYKGQDLSFQVISESGDEVAYVHNKTISADTLYIPGIIKHEDKTYRVVETREDPSGFHSYSSCRIDVIVFEEGITVISSKSFFLQKGLRSISLPNSLIRIEDGAFAHTGLTDIEIPESVEFIGYASFWSDQNYIEKIDGKYYRGTLRLPKHKVEISEQAFAIISHRTGKKAYSYFTFIQLPEGTTKRQLSQWYIGQADETIVKMLREEDEVVKY